MASVPCFAGEKVALELCLSNPFGVPFTVRSLALLEERAEQAGGARKEGGEFASAPPRGTVDVLPVRSSPAVAVAAAGAKKNAPPGNRRRSEGGEKAGTAVAGVAATGAAYGEQQLGTRNQYPTRRHGTRCSWVTLTVRPRRPGRLRVTGVCVSVLNVSLLLRCDDNTTTTEVAGAARSAEQRTPARREAASAKSMDKAQGPVRRVKLSSWGLLPTSSHRRAHMHRGTQW